VIEIDLQDFLRSGALGPVQVGMTRDQVRHELGEPDATGGASRQYRTPSIWFYGSLELIFERSGPELVSIHLDGFDVPSGCNRIVLDPWCIRGAMPLEEAETALGLAGIGFSRHPWRATPNGTLVVTQSNVEMGFILEEEEFGSPAGLFFIMKSGIFTNQ